MENRSWYTTAHEVYLCVWLVRGEDGVEGIALLHAIQGGKAFDVRGHLLRDLHRDRVVKLAHSKAPQAAPAHHTTWGAVAHVADRSQPAGGGSVRSAGHGAACLMGETHLSRHAFCSKVSFAGLREGGFLLENSGVLEKDDLRDAPSAPVAYPAHLRNAVPPQRARHAGRSAKLFDEFRVFVHARIKHHVYHMSQQAN